MLAGGSVLFGEVIGQRVLGESWCKTFLLSLLSSRTLTNIEDSDVYQMLQKDQEEAHAPRQSGSFKALQDFIDSDGEITV